MAAQAVDLHQELGVLGERTRLVKQTDRPIGEARQPRCLRSGGKQPAPALIVIGQACRPLESSAGDPVRASLPASDAGLFQSRRGGHISADGGGREMPGAPVRIPIRQDAGHRAVGGSAHVRRSRVVDRGSRQRMTKLNSAVTQPDEAGLLCRSQPADVDVEEASRPLECRKIGRFVDGGEDQELSC